MGRLAALALLLACGRVDLPGDGEIACSPDNDCPRGMSCAGDGFCYRAPPPVADAEPEPEPAPDAADASLLLDITFEGNAVSRTGTAPLVEEELVYVAGHSGEGLDMQPPSRLEYPASALSAAEGTIELWIAPSWSADDGLNHHFVTWGSDHGLLLFRDANQNLRLIVNRFGTAGSPPAERGVSYNIAFARPGTWYRVAATWSPTELALYLDGNQVGRATDVTAFAEPGTNVAVGSENATRHADAVLDDLRTWSVARSAEQLRR